jgi:hypothetical protein
VIELSHADELSWSDVSGHRQGPIRFKRLLQGEPGSPGNFELSVIRSGVGYYTPRHRHNFDQVRLGLSGRFNYSPKRDLEAGQVGYFPEGTFYGPQESPEETRVLLLQFGGASGSGFMSYDQLTAGYEALRGQGRFDGGVFRRADGAGRANQDGSEAVWEHVNGRPVRYPAPRYEEPVLMRPESFAWRPVESESGVTERRLGSFSECDTELAFVALEAGARHRVPEQGDWLLFCTGGAGRVGDRPWRAHSALRAPDGSAASLSADEASELFAIRLPALEKSARPSRAQ